VTFHYNAHTLPGRAYHAQPKPVNKCAQFSVGGQLTSMKNAPAHD